MSKFTYFKQTSKIQDGVGWYGITSKAHQGLKW